MSLSIDDIRMIRRIAELGSLSLVARDSGLSVSSVSERLKDVEKLLGVRLFLRTTRSLSITEEGRRFVKASNRLIAEWEALEASVRDEGALSGPIRITSPVHIGSEVLAPLLDHFQRQNPETTIDLHLSDRLVDLVSGGYDLALRIGEISDSRLKVRHLMDTTSLLVASPTYLAEKGIPKHPDDLQAHRCILRRSGDSLFEEWEFRCEGLSCAVKIKPTLICNSGAQTLLWALGGAGITTVTTLDVEKDITDGRLQPLLEGWYAPKIPLNLLSPPGDHEPQRVTALKEVIIAAFKTLSEAGETGESSRDGQ